MTTKPFGNYLRQRRVQANLSLRSVADALGVSHVYLSEVERGVRSTIAEERWPALVAAIPGITVADLERMRDVSKPVQMEISDAPVEYQNLALALARRIQKKDIPSADINRLIELLGGQE